MVVLRTGRWTKLHLLLVTLLTKLNVSGFECFWKRVV